MLKPRERLALLEKHRWLTFLLPFIVFMLITGMEPTPDTLGGFTVLLPIQYDYYPLVYTIKIALTVLAVWFVWPGYKQFPFKVSPLAVVVGIVGIVLWVGICSFKIESTYIAPALDKIGMGSFVPSGTRAGFNPLEQMSDTPVLAWAFLAVRFFGLAVVVAVIEEMFLRGFVMRFVVQANWWELPIGQVTVTSAIVGTVFPMLMHPAELLAAAVWFSMVTWLMIRTKNIWDCVVAHAVTNFLLGVYVVYSGHWELM